MSFVYKVYDSWSLSLIHFKNTRLLSVLRQMTRYAFACARSLKSSRLVFVRDRGRSRGSLASFPVPESLELNIRD